MTPDLYKLSALKAFLQEHGLEPKKSLGQNFLFHRREAEKIAAVAQISAEDQLLEVGPGLGHLTAVLAESGAGITAVEIDRRLTALWPELHPDFPGTLIEQDILEADLGRLRPVPTKVLGNLPYYIAQDIIERLVTCGIPFASLTFTLQEEEVRRLALTDRKDKRYARINALLQALGPVRMAAAIAPDNFYPRPHIASAILHIGPVTWPEPKVWQTLQTVLAAAFRQKRKMLRTNLAELGLEPRDWEAAGLSPDQRPQEPAPEQYLRLAEILAAK